MPNAGRTVSRSVGVLERNGYTRQQAARIIKDVAAAIGDGKYDFEPWAADWLRQVWRAAHALDSYYQDKPPGAAGKATPEQESKP